MSLDGQVAEDEESPAAAATVATPPTTSEPAGGRIAASIVWARSFLLSAGPGSPSEGAGTWFGRKVVVAIVAALVGRARAGRDQE